MKKNICNLLGGAGNGSFAFERSGTEADCYEQGFLSDWMKRVVMFGLFLPKPVTVMSLRHLGTV